MPEETARKICIASGKGGVGKTLVTANLGLALGELGYSTIIVDADLDMANLEMVLGMEGRPITLQDVIKGNSDIEDTVYTIKGSDNTKIVPAGISPRQFRRMDPDKFERAINRLAEQCDILIVDAPAGIGKDTIACFHACEELLLVATPESISAADALKARNVAEKMGCEIKGAVVNRVHEKNYGMSNKEIQSFLKTKVLAQFNETPIIRKSTSERKPMTLHYPENKFTKEMYNLAEALTGKTYIKKEKEKKGILSKLKNIFNR